ncbi:MAG: hypothetical protein OXH99_22390 [Bryobacterales bacterium]|nr:hypothetical protein [Bryobacterales bacterium]
MEQRRSIIERPETSRATRPAVRAGLPHGYPLHVDATYDKGRGDTFRRLDGWPG